MTRGANRSTHAKCRIFEWDMDMWCRLKGTEMAVLEAFGMKLTYPLCKKHYDYVNNL